MSKSDKRRSVPAAPDLCEWPGPATPDDCDRARELTKKNPIHIWKSTQVSDTDWQAHCLCGWKSEPGSEWNADTAGYAHADSMKGASDG